MNPTSFDYVVIKESDMKDEIVKDQELNGIYLHKSSFKDWSIDQKPNSTKKMFSGQTTYSLTEIDQRIPGLTEITTNAEIIPIPLNVKTIIGGPITDSENSLTKLDLKYNVTEVPDRFISSLTNLRELHISPQITEDCVGNMLTTWSSTERYDELFYNDGRLKCGYDMVNFRTSNEDTTNKLEKIIFRRSSRVNENQHSIHEHEFTKGTNNNLYIKAAMFENMKGLKTLLIPPLYYVPPRMCRNCSSLKSLDLCDTAKYISSRAFENCSNLKAVVGGSNIEYLGESAFRNCGLLTINNWYWLRTCSADSFANCTNLKFIAFDWSRIGPAYLYFGPRVFANCTDLRAVDFTDMYMENADYISHIDREYTDRVYGYVDINTSDGDFNKAFDRMFYNCPKLEYVKLGRTCERIGQEMFSGCTSLVSIQMPTLVREFGSNIFLNCSNLKEITLSISDDTYEIGWGLFRGCRALEIIRLDLSRIYTFTQFKDIEQRIQDANIDDRYPRFRHFTIDDLRFIAASQYDSSYYNDCFKPFVDCRASWIIDVLAHCEPNNGLINVEVTFGGYDDYKMVDAFNLATVIMNSNRIYYATDLLEQQFGVFNPRGTYYLTTVRT